MIWWSFFIPWISSTGKKRVRVLVQHTVRPLTVLILDHSKPVISQLRALTDTLYVDENIDALRLTEQTQLCRKASISPFLLLKYFRSLQSFPACLLLQMHACCTSTVFSGIQNCGFSPQPGEWRTGEMGEDSQAWTRLYDFQQHLHNCMHLMQCEYTVPAWMITSYLQTAP